MSGYERPINWNVSGKDAKDAEIERLRAENEALRKLLLECAAFMGEFSEDSWLDLWYNIWDQKVLDFFAESAALRQACELAQHDMTEKP